MADMSGDLVGVVAAALVIVGAVAVVLVVAGQYGRQGWRRRNKRRR